MFDRKETKKKRYDTNCWNESMYWIDAEERMNINNESPNLKNPFIIK